MTIGAVIVFVIGILVFMAFGLYAAFHREDDDKHDSINKHKHV